MWTIALQGMEFYAYHGYYSEEQVIGGTYIVDIHLTVNGDLAHNDELANTVNYEIVYQVCNKVMKQPVKLLETILAKIADEMQEKYPHILKFKGKIIKKSPPLGGKVENAVVELEKIFAQ